MTALRVAAALHSSDTIGQAARASGIGRTTLYRWPWLGWQGDPRFADWLVPSRSYGATP